MMSDFLKVPLSRILPHGVVPTGLPVEGPSGRPGVVVSGFDLMVALVDERGRHAEYLRAKENALADFSKPPIYMIDPVWWGLALVHRICTGSDAMILEVTDFVAEEGFGVVCHTEAPARKEGQPAERAQWCLMSSRRKGPYPFANFDGANVPGAVDVFDKAPAKAYNLHHDDFLLRFLVASALRTKPVTFKPDPSLSAATGHEAFAAHKWMEQAAYRGWATGWGDSSEKPS